MFVVCVFWRCQFGAHFPPIIISETDSESVTVPIETFDNTVPGLGMHFNEAGFMKQNLFFEILHNWIPKHVPGGLKQGVLHQVTRFLEWLCWNIAIVLPRLR